MTDISRVKKFIDNFNKPTVVVENGRVSMTVNEFFKQSNNLDKMKKICLLQANLLKQHCMCGEFETCYSCDVQSKIDKVLKSRKDQDVSEE